MTHRFDVSQLNDIRLIVVTSVQLLQTPYYTDHPKTLSVGRVSELLDNRPKMLTSIRGNTLLSFICQGVL
jgi:hypothetical protein